MLPKTLSQEQHLFYVQIKLKIFLFDYFYNEKNAEIKIGFGFIFQSIDKTITETQVNNIMSVIIDKAKKFDDISIPGLI